MKSLLVGESWTEKIPSKSGGKNQYVKMSKAICSYCNEIKTVRVGNWNRTKEKWTCDKCMHIPEVKGTHGASRTRLYTIWQLMKRRTIGVKTELEEVYYKDIGLCSEWNNFSIFQKWSNENGYTDTKTIDRIESTKDYCPDNCRWTTQFVQSQNQGKSKVNKSGYRGVYFDKSRQKWVGTLEHEHKTWRKRYDTIEEAINGRNEKIREVGGFHPVQEYIG